MSNPDPIDRPIESEADGPPLPPADLWASVEAHAQALWNDDSKRPAFIHLRDRGRDLARRAGIAEATVTSRDRDLITANEELGRRANRIEAMVRDLSDQVRRFDQFQEEVRAAAIDAARANDLCEEGLDEWLDGLGLAKVSRSWKVEVEVTYGTRKATIEVEKADDEDDAREQARRSAEGLGLNDEEWDDEPDIDNISIESVERDDD
jgi:hypothetical protein